MMDKSDTTALQIFSNQMNYESKQQGLNATFHTNSFGINLKATIILKNKTKLVFSFEEDCSITQTQNSVTGYDAYTIIGKPKNRSQFHIPQFGFVEFVNPTPPHIAFEANMSYLDEDQKEVTILLMKVATKPQSRPFLLSQGYETVAMSEIKPHLVNYENKQEMAQLTVSVTEILFYVYTSLKDPNLK